MKNEHGFILPVTITISFLFFLVFTFQVNAYMTEKAFSKETEEILILENLMQIGAGDIQTMLEIEVESVESMGSFSYRTGTISYSVSPLTPTTSRVVLSCITNDRRKYSARFVYDHETQMINSWIEIR